MEKNGMSIASKFSFYLGAIVALSVFVVGMIGVLWSYDLRKKDFISLYESSTANLSELMSLELQEKDFQGMEKAADTFFLDESVKSITVYDINDSIVLIKEKKVPPNHISVSKTIFYGNKALGKLKVSFGYDTLIRDFVDSIAMILLLVVVLIAVIQISSSFLFSRFIKKPLDKLMAYIQNISNGRYDEKIEKSCGEFLKIEESFAKMVLEIKNRETKLRESSYRLERLDTALEVSKFAVEKSMIEAYWIKTDGSIVYANSSARKNLGYSEQEFGKLTVFDIDPDLDEQLWSSHMEKIKDEQSMVFQRKQKRKDGSLYDVEVTSNYLVYKDKKYNFSFVQDITERIKTQKRLMELNNNLEKLIQQRTMNLEKAYAQLDEANEGLVAMNQELLAMNQELQAALNELGKTQKSLIESEKMAALGKLVGGIAHEINTPLGNGLVGSTYISDENRKILNMHSKGELTKSCFEEFLRKNIETSDIIVLNLKKAAGLVASLKEISVDQSSQEKRKFNLKKYLEDIVLTMNYPLKKNGHRTEIDCDENLDIESFPGALSQIITNLVSNSVTHGFEGLEKRTIKIKAVLINELSDKNKQMIELVYSDNGHGIIQQDIEKIYDPFFTTNRSKGNTGLGLSIVYNLVTQTLKGSIKCHSIKNEGTVFTVSFPVSSVSR